MRRTLGSRSSCSGQPGLRVCQRACVWLAGVTLLHEAPSPRSQTRAESHSFEKGSRSVCTENMASYACVYIRYHTVFTAFDLVKKVALLAGANSRCPVDIAPTGGYIAWILGACRMPTVNVYSTRDTEAVVQCSIAVCECIMASQRHGA